MQRLKQSDRAAGHFLELGKLSQTLLGVLLVARALLGNVGNSVHDEQGREDQRDHHNHDVRVHNSFLFSLCIIIHPNNIISLSYKLVPSSDGIETSYCQKSHCLLNYFHPSRGASSPLAVRPQPTYPPLPQQQPPNR